MTLSGHLLRSIALTQFRECPLFVLGFSEHFLVLLGQPSKTCTKALIMLQGLPSLQQVFLSTRASLEKVESRGREGGGGGEVA